MDRPVAEVLQPGRSLPPGDWARRHHGILLLGGPQAVALGAFGLWMGQPTLHVMGEAGLVLALVALAGWAGLPRRARSVVASLALVTTSAILVHFSGGYIEAHFHFFVMLGVISLYEDWAPYGLAVAYVAVHHGIVGTLDPQSVYNHPAAFADPWLWAGIHAFFVAGLSLVNLVLWRVNQETRLKAAAATVEARRRTERVDKMAAMGSLVSGVAHEIRTPLTYIQSNLYLLERDGADPARKKEALAACLEGVERINGIVGTLREFTRGTPYPTVSRSLVPTVQEAADLFRATHRGMVRLNLRLRPTPPVAHRPAQVQQVVLNLLDNAADAAPSTPLEVETGAGERGEAVLIVEDHGPGLPESVHANLFHPLVTTKRDGMGLGLSIVKRIVDEHRATVEVESTPKGTRFTIRFPAAGPKDGEHSSTGAQTPLPPAR